MVGTRFFFGEILPTNLAKIFGEILLLGSNRFLEMFFLFERDYFWVSDFFSYFSRLMRYDVLHTLTCDMGMMCILLETLPQCSFEMK